MFGMSFHYIYEGVTDYRYVVRRIKCTVVVLNNEFILLYLFAI